MTTTNQLPWYDCLGYTATIAESERAKGLGPKPTTEALRLRPLNFINRGYDVGGSIGPREAIELSRTLNPNAPIVIDDEDRLGRMFRVQSTPQPEHHDDRRKAADELIELVRCLVSTPIGERAAQQGVGFYQGIIGASHPGNGGDWWSNWGATNRIVFGKKRHPAVGLCLSEGTLADVTTLPVISAYVAYNDDRVETERLNRAFEMSAELYEARPLVFIGMRYPSGYEEAARRFDFVRPEHMTRAIEIAYPRAAGIVLWTWNGYGPEGYSGKRDNNGYPYEISSACGAGWDPNLPAWKAVEAFRAKLDAPKPKTDTIDARTIKPLFGGDGRGRKV